MPYSRVQTMQSSLHHVNFTIALQPQTHADLVDTCLSVVSLVRILDAQQQSRRLHHLMSRLLIQQLKYESSHQIRGKNSYKDVGESSFFSVSGMSQRVKDKSQSQKLFRAPVLFRGQVCEPLARH